MAYAQVESENDSNSTLTVKTMIRRLISILICGTLFNPFLKASTDSSIIIFAAASTTNVISEAAADFSAENKTTVLTSFAASSTLARQIERGAPAHLFVSANKKWMNYLQTKNHIQASSTSILFSNRLVLITAMDGYSEVKIDSDLPLESMLADGHIAMANPDHTPMGIYAKKSLKKLGLWSTIESRIAKSKDVRAALTLVERKEVPLGVVYVTDSRISKKVRVLGEFPVASHPPIIYLTALLKGVKDEKAIAFLNYLKSASAKAIYKNHGFVVGEL